MIALHHSETFRNTTDGNLGMVGVSAGMHLLRMECLRMAPLSAPVLVQGETGTGKELVAANLHNCSRRSSRNMVAVNSGALNHSMFEDLLFGHNRGAFTGAAANHRGVFERADGGTLFLDEIGELPLAQQAALLRVLDTQKICRIGGEEEREVNFRLVAATNRDLLEMVDEGKFRLDLYHRISALKIETAPLRARPEDITPLARHFLSIMEKDLGRKTLSDCTRDLLESHQWPGNARELRNVLYRGAAMTSESTLRAVHLEIEKPRIKPKPCSFRLDKVPAGKIEDLVQRHQGNLAAAARELGVARTTLRDKVKRMRTQDTELSVVAN